MLTVPFKHRRPRIFGLSPATVFGQASAGLQQALLKLIDQRSIPAGSTKRRHRLPQAAGRSATAASALFLLAVTWNLGSFHSQHHPSTVMTSALPSRTTESAWSFAATRAWQSAVRAQHAAVFACMLLGDVAAFSASPFPLGEAMRTSRWRAPCPGFSLPPHWFQKGLKRVRINPSVSDWNRAKIGVSRYSGSRIASGGSHLVILL